MKKTTQKQPNQENKREGNIYDKIVKENIESIIPAFHPWLVSPLYHLQQQRTMHI
jgi:hypothetical protein